LEKALKAHVCVSTQAVPPRIHNLRRLYDISGLPQNKKFDSTLAEINQFNLEGRYPEVMPIEPDIEAASLLIQQVDTLYQWLMKQF
jgi:HEPN domain-containing protein